MNFEPFDDEELLDDVTSRAAAHENALRRKLAAAIEGARARKGLSIRGLAKAIETSLSQVQRLLHKQLGGSLSLFTICKAAEQLDLDVSLEARPREATLAPQVIRISGVIDGLNIDQLARLLPEGRTWSSIVHHGRDASLISETFEQRRTSDGAWQNAQEADFDVDDEADEALMPKVA